MRSDQLGRLAAGLEHELSQTLSLKMPTSRSDRLKDGAELQAMLSYFTKGGTMKASFILMVLQGAWRYFLRELVVNAIDNPDSEVDEAILGVLDSLFDYSAE